MADLTRSRPPDGDHRAAPPGPRADDRSLGDLLGELATETSTLIRQEIALAKTEIRRDVREAGKSAGLIAAGGAVAYAGLIVLLLGLGLLLGQLLGEGLIWLGVFLFGLTVALAGYVLLRKNLADLKAIDPLPEQTIQTLKEDKEWLKTETT